MMMSMMLMMITLTEIPAFCIPMLLFINILAYALTLRHSCFLIRSSKLILILRCLNSNNADWSLQWSLSLISNVKLAITFSTMACWIPLDSITQEIIVPNSRNIEYTMRVDVELRQDGQQAQQQLTAVGQQQQANYQTKYQKNFELEIRKQHYCV